MTPADALTAAAARYRQGDPGACLELCVPLLTTEAAATAAELAILCVAELGRGELAPAILAVIEQRGLPMLVIARRACQNILKLRKTAALLTLAEQAPAGHALHVLALYHAACAVMVEGTRERALVMFERFRMIVRDYFPVVPFTMDDSFNVLFRQGTLVLPAASVARRLAEPAGAVVLSDFTLDRRAAGDGAVYLACADGRYIERFADRFAAAFDRPGVSLHLHVVNATPAADALLAGLPGGLHHLSLGVSRSQDRHYASATAYACARFYVMPILLDLYGRMLVALDIDVVPLPPALRLGAGDPAPDFDFGCFETGRDEPASVYQASVMAWTPTDSCRRFLGALQGFCTPKLDMPVRLNWQLDQAALISVLNWQDETGQAFRFGRLNDRLACRFDEAVAPVAGDLEKLAIKEGAKGIDPRYVDADGVVRFPWAP
jgi:hypothetical protein